MFYAVRYTANQASRSDRMGCFGVFASRAASYLLLIGTWLCGAVMTLSYVAVQDEEGHVVVYYVRLVSGRFCYTGRWI